MNYYNEFEPFAAEWLKELIKDGLIPDGEVDTRSIVDVEPGDLKDFTQCHFFAGIGGWAYAARLARWRDDRPMWTGSPPCQPFSVAGKQKGTDDERHLWPVWFNLVRECRPSIIFGEQVSSAIRHGWLDSLQEDLEAENYACAAAVLPASGVGALHKRDRLWIVAHASGSGRQGWGGSECSEQREIRQDGALCSSDGRCGEMADTDAHGRIESMQSVSGELSERTRSDGVNDLGLADSIGEGSQGRLSGGQDQKRPVECGHPGCDGATDGMADTMRERQSESRSLRQRGGSESDQEGQINRVINAGKLNMADSNDIGHQWNEGTGREAERRAEYAGNDSLADSDNSGQRSDGGPVQQDQWHNTWGRCQAVQCKDGKVRAIPTEPEIFPLANGIPNRVGILRGAGNAIVPQVAAEIIRAFV